jgi:hypothetical protein
MDEVEFIAILEELSSVLSPVVNSGASREVLHRAAKDALRTVTDALDELDSDEEEEEEQEGDEEEDGDEEEKRPDEAARNIS